MTTRPLTSILTAFVLAACAHDTTAPADRALDARAFARAPASTTYTYSLNGDVTTDLPLGSASAKTGDPFNNVTVSNVTVTLGTPSGNIAACRTGAGIYDMTFGAHAGGSWSG